MSNRASPCIHARSKGSGSPGPLLFPVIRSLSRAGHGRTFVPCRQLPSMHGSILMGPSTSGALSCANRGPWIPRSTSSSTSVKLREPRTPQCSAPEHPHRIHPPYARHARPARRTPRHQGRAPRDPYTDETRAHFLPAGYSRGTRGFSLSAFRRNAPRLPPIEGSALPLAMGRAPVEGPKAPTSGRTGSAKPPFHLMFRQLRPNVSSPPIHAFQPLLPPTPAGVRPHASVNQKR